MSVLFVFVFGAILISSLVSANVFENFWGSITGQPVRSIDVSKDVGLIDGGLDVEIQNYTCTDSDGGIEPFIFGSCVVSYEDNNTGGAGGKSDYCASSTILNECYCNGDSTSFGIIPFEQIPCGGGCENGVCLNESNSTGGGGGGGTYPMDYYIGLIGATDTSATINVTLIGEYETEIAVYVLDENETRTVIGNLNLQLFSADENMGSMSAEFAISHRTLSLGGSYPPNITINIMKDGFIDDGFSFNLLGTTDTSATIQFLGGGVASLNEVLEGEQWILPIDQPGPDMLFLLSAEEGGISNSVPSATVSIYGFDLFATGGNETECTTNADCPSESMSYCSGDYAYSNTTYFSCQYGQCVEQGGMGSATYCDEGCVDGECVVGTNVTNSSTLCGDVNSDFSVDISDLLFLVDYQFDYGPAPENMDLANVDGKDGVDVGDILYFVDYIFGNSTSLNCPSTGSSGGGGGEPIECTLTGAEWVVGNTTSVYEGDVVPLRVYGNNCDGKLANFYIYEDDTIGGDDQVMNNPPSVLFSNGVATTNWVAEWQFEGFPETSPPEYYFIAGPGNSLIASSEPMLNVLSGTNSTN